jgi:SAM-dependent methyltransferase
VTIIKKIRDLLTEPSVRGLDVDGPEYSIVHREALRRKAILRQLEEKTYRECRSMDLRYFKDCPGKRLEIGAGSSFIKELYPDVMTSDIKQLPFVDIVSRAEQLPFRDDSLRAIYAIAMFHHLPEPRTFFTEALRVLRSGGGIVLIEPYYGLFARWFFRRLFEFEGYYPNAQTWETSGQTGPFSNPNVALSYVVFKRDQAQFEKEFPELALLLDRPHTHLWRLVSGGLNFRQLVPDKFTQLVRLAEWMLTPFNRWIALRHTIVLRKQ